MSDDPATNYVLGSLSPAERREIERRRLYEPALDAAIDRLEAQMAPLAAAAGEIAPPSGLFDRILDAVATADARGRAISRLPFGEGAWQPYSPGVARKYLWDNDTFLLRCEPGAVIPPHGHPMTEHLIVIAGDLLIDGVEFGTGDYHTMPAGTRHDDAWTRAGCILFIQSRA